MKRIIRANALEYEFDFRHEPKLYVSEGESFVIAVSYTHLTLPTTPYV